MKLVSEIQAAHPSYTLSVGLVQKIGQLSHVERFVGVSNGHSQGGARPAISPNVFLTRNTSLNAVSLRDPMRLRSE
jgi:hypothetical protein